MRRGREPRRQVRSRRVLRALGVALVAAGLLVVSPIGEALAASVDPSTHLEQPRPLETSPRRQRVDLDRGIDDVLASATGRDHHLRGLDEHRPDGAVDDRRPVVVDELDHDVRPRRRRQRPRRPCRPWPCRASSARPTRSTPTTASRCWPGATPSCGEAPPLEPWPSAATSASGPTTWARSPPPCSTRSRSGCSSAEAWRPRTRSQRLTVGANGRVLVGDLDALTTVPVGRGVAVVPAGGNVDVNPQIRTAGPQGVEAVGVARHVRSGVPRRLRRPRPAGRILAASPSTAVVTDDGREPRRRPDAPSPSTCRLPTATARSSGR